MIFAEIWQFWLVVYRFYVNKNLFLRGESGITRQILVLEFWVRVLAEEIPRSVVGKHETCVVLGVGSNTTVRNF